MGKGTESYAAKTAFGGGKRAWKAVGMVGKQETAATYLLPEGYMDCSGFACLKSPIGTLIGSCGHKESEVKSVRRWTLKSVRR